MMKAQTPNKALRIVLCVIGLALVSVLTVGLISASAANEMTVQFDDYIDVEGKTVEIIDAGKPTSFKVGYGIAANTPDDAVITKSGNSLVATGVGTAKVKIDGEEITITVKPAPLSVLLLAGQSNMRGSEGNKNQSIVCPTGRVYSTYGVPEDMTVKNASSFATSALTGSKSTINVNGTTTCLSSNPIYSLVDKGSGKLGADSGLAYEWTLQTDEKIWVINAAHGGSTIESWLETGDNFKEAVALFNACMNTLQKEIDAGHFTLSHMGYLWCQGEASTNANTDAVTYINQFTTMHANFKSVMAYDFDHDPSTPKSTFEFAGNIQVRKGSENSGTYRKGEYPDNYVKAGENIDHYESFYDLRMSGPRVAQYWMANNPDLPDIWNVCTVQEKWVVFPDGTNGVADYFKAHYPNGRVDYETQTAVSESWRKPTTPKDVHDSIHYNQIGYNEIGRESTRNILYILGMVTPPETETTVEFVCWDGFTPVTDIDPFISGRSETLVVPIVSPTYKSKSVSYKTNGNLSYDYYDLTANTYVSFGTLEAVGAKGSVVTVNPIRRENYSWKLEGNKLTSTGDDVNKAIFLEGSYSNGQFSDAIVGLEKPIYFVAQEPWSLEWKMSGTWYGTGSINAKKLFAESNAMVDVGGMLILVNGKTGGIAFGQYTGAKTLLYGINLKDHNISLADSHVYKFLNKVNADGSNMVYLYVDGKEIGPMNNVLNSDGSDSGKDDNWISGKQMAFRYLGAPRYALDMGSIEYINAITHTHEYVEEIVAPTCTEKGYTSHTCECGDTYKDTEVDAKGHDYKETVTAPTCTEKGKTTYTCECGDTYEEEIEPVGHSYDNDKDADCNVCGETRTVETEPSTGKDKEKGGCGSAKSSGLALISLFLCAQVGVFFKKRRF